MVIHNAHLVDRLVHRLAFGLALYGLVKCCVDRVKLKRIQCEDNSTHSTTSNTTHEIDHN